jgi:DNA-binding SARP family transcriptional activator
MKEVMITTVDNPFDPFEDFDNWFQFDTEKGYYTSSRLCRIASFEDDMTEKEQFEELERAIDRLIEIDPLNMYKKVTKEIKED